MSHRLLKSIDEVAQLFPTPLEALLFKVAMKIPPLKHLPLRFRWQNLPFRARVIDYYGSIEDVLIFQEYGLLKEVMAGIQCPPVILDAGANIGAFAIYMLSLRPDAMIHSLELSNNTFQWLAENARLVNNPNWQVHNVALWKEDSTVNFVNNNGLSSTSHVTANGGDSVAKAMSLETLIKKHTPAEHVHVLKMDIEGAEDVVLAASEAMLDKVDHFVIEIHPDATDEISVRKIIRRHFTHLTTIQRDNQAMPLLLANR
jgi:FkbM family methyltransferase